MRELRTTPDQTLTGMPPGVPYIIGNELAERFSFYGMKAILTIFMAQYMLDSAGQPDRMNPEQAKSVMHLFTAAAYFFPLVGAVIADAFWGKYKTILIISLMYCVGHGLLALMDVGPMTGKFDMRPLLYAGLFCIAVGAGGIKPCVSANVGDQFGAGNKRLITMVYNWFYFSINLGSMVSTLLIPKMLEWYGPWAAFGLPGVLMAVATFIFWLGRDKFVHVPPSGWDRFVAETFSPDGRRALSNLIPLFLIFVPVFWAIFDQTAGAWVLQAEAMDRRFAGMTWLSSQIQAANPALILIMIPLFTYVVYPAMGKFFEPTPLRKIGVGFVLTVAACVISALIETAISQDAPRVAGELWAALQQAGIPDLPATQPRTLSEVVTIARGLPEPHKWTQEQLAPFLGQMPSIGWQFIAYVVLTAAEIMVSIVCLEFAYTQSPPRMKSFVLAVYLLGVSFGNLFVSGLNFVLDKTRYADGSTWLEGPIYYWFFAGLMALATVAYIVFAQFYKGRTYIQGVEPPTTTPARED